jgi:hypothetical protein
LFLRRAQAGLLRSGLAMELDASGWSGEGGFTQVLIDALRALPAIRAVRVEDAPASRADAAFSFISNELYVTFDVSRRRVRIKRLGFIPATAEVEERTMTLSALEALLTAMDEIGPPDYSDGGMLQYLRTERIVPPYQTRGVKVVELVRVYEATWTRDR